MTYKENSNVELISTRRGWTNKIYVATVAGGVYYTENFYNPSIQPTWQAINSGLDALDCAEFHLDPINEELRQYVLIGSTNTLYRRTNSSAWVDILNPGNVTDVTGMSEPQITGFSPDIFIPGRIWALCTGWAAPFVQPFFPILSSDYGNTWLPAIPAWSGFTVSGLYSIRTNGNDVYFNALCRNNAWTGNRIFSSIDGGMNWEDHKLVNVAMAMNPLMADRVYCPWGWFQGDVLATLVHEVEAATVVNENVSISNYDSMWFNRLNVNHQRVVYFGKIYTTYNKWATINTPSYVDLEPTSISPYASRDPRKIIVGHDVSPANKNHCISTLDGDNDVTITGIAGTNHATAPYIGAIPWTASRPCRCGIQGVMTTLSDNNYGMIPFECEDI